MSRIGVFGGTFDPVHVGHLAAAVNVRYSLNLDRLLLVVANVPWQKAGRRVVSPAEDRLAMVETAVEGIPGLEASRIEMDRGGASYTADTLAELGSANPGAELFLVVGADVVGELDTWERVEAVRDGCTLVVVKRPGSRPRLPTGWRAAVVEVPSLDISSTDLRARVIDGRPLDFLVPAPVVTLIRSRRLYSEPTDDSIPNRIHHPGRHGRQGRH
ncbi:MAG TPA: nicotinate-nucleotide adenylyltransferase [Acidimicrobiales bacterium]|nr:nicotinate-nucleotide adenylyltransferase [Acidimicrobiales bacterium]